VMLVSGMLDRFAVPFRSASANGVSLLGPRRDCSGSTVKGEPWAWFRWCEFLSATSSSISLGLSIVLNTTFFFPFMLFQGIEVSVGTSMVWMELLDVVLVVNWITFHIFMICSILLMFIIVFRAVLLLARSIADALCRR